MKPSPPEPNATGPETKSVKFIFKILSENNNITVVGAEMSWDLVVGWRELAIYEEVSWLGDAVAWVEVGWEVSWNRLWSGCTD